MTEIWSQYETWMRSRVLRRSARAYIAWSVKLLTRTRPMRRSLGKLANSNTEMSVRWVQSKSKVGARHVERERATHFQSLQIATVCNTLQAI